MMHVECLPDQTLVVKLGFPKRMVTHHQGKSRVLAELKRKHHRFALVDEDPHAPKLPYEKNLTAKEEFDGVMVYSDANGILYLSLK